MTSRKWIIWILFFLALIPWVGSGILGAEKKPAADSSVRWVKVYSIGDEFIGMKKEIRVDDNSVKKLFAKDRPYLRENWRAAVSEKIETAPGAKRIPEGVEKGWIEAKDKNPYARVLQFSEKELIVLIVAPKGIYLWHHFHECLARLRISRNKEIDAIFKVPSLEKTYGAIYKGLKQGDSVEKVKKRLGEPDVTNTFQAVGFETLCYIKEDIIITINAGEIERIDRGVPESIKKKTEK